MSEMKKTFEWETLNPEFPYMPKEEWHNRIKKAKELMKRDGLDALVILHNKNLIYYFGAEKSYKYMFPTVGIIPQDGPTISIRESLDANHLELQGYAERNISYKGDEKAPTEYAPHGADLTAEVIGYTIERLRSY